MTNWWTDLKPCPFCGAVGKLLVRGDEHPPGYDVVCLTEGCYLEDGADRYFDSPEEAVENWNTRWTPTKQ